MINSDNMVIYKFWNFNFDLKITFCPKLGTSTSLSVKISPKCQINFWKRPQHGDLEGFTKL